MHQYCDYQSERGEGESTILSRILIIISNYWMRRVQIEDEDNTLRDLHNSSYHTKAEFNNCFIIHSKYFQSFKNIQNFFLIGFCRVHGKIARYLKTMNKKQEKKHQQNFIQGSDKFAVRSKIRMNFLRVRSPLNTI